MGRTKHDGRESRRDRQRCSSATFERRSDLMLDAPSEAQWNQLRMDVGRLVARRLPTRADVEDVVQDVLLRVWRNGDDLRDEERFGGWLSRIAQTAAADHMRDRQRHPVPRYQSSPAVDTAEAAPEASGEEPATRSLIATVLRPFIERLPDTYRETVVLSELDGLPHAAIAKRLGLSVSGVKSRVQRGRAQLRALLERCCKIALDIRGAPVSCEVRPDGDPPSACQCRADSPKRQAC
jgi:RNA polymerase sigma-70 factor (ECF subfamily)